MSFVFLNRKLKMSEHYHRCLSLFVTFNILLSPGILLVNLLNFVHDFCLFYYGPAIYKTAFDNRSYKYTSEWIDIDCTSRTRW